MLKAFYLIFIKKLRKKKYFVKGFI